MTDIKDKNVRLECPYCKDDFLIKSYSKHLIDNHKTEIFVNKHNKQELSEVANKKETWWPSPLEIKMKDKTQYLVTCCNKFYSKETQARKHSKDKECRANYVKNAKELLSSVAPVNISNTHSGSGDIINNITQNITIVDLSGNILKTIKRLVNNADYKEQERAYNHKKLEKLRAKYKDDPDYDSDISTVDSYYGDDESDDYKSKLERFIPEVELDKETVKAFNKYGIDISREGLGLRTKEDSEREKQEKKESEIDDLETKIDECDNCITTCEDDIDKYKRIMTDTDNDINKINCKTKISKIQILLEATKKEKNKYQEQLNKLKGK